MTLTVLSWISLDSTCQIQITMQLGPTGCSKGFCAHPLEINLSLSF